MQFLRYSFLFIFLIFPSISAYARPVIFTIDANSNNAMKIGTFIGGELQKNFPNIESQYDGYLASLLSPSQYKQLLPQVKSLITAIDSDYQAEVNAIAAVLQLETFDDLGDGKLSVNEFWLLQFLADITDINKGSAIATPNDNNPVVARNVDWKSTPDLRNLQTISIYQYDDRTLVTIGLAGLVGVINGFNDQGLFVSLVDASTQQISTSLLPKNASGFDMRTLLRQNNKIAAASHEIAEKQYPRSHLILFADQENVAVLEQSADEIGKLRKTDSVIVNEMPWRNNRQLAVVGCFVLKTSEPNCHASKDFFRWGRFTELLKTFLDQNLSASKAAALMQDKENIHQAIFNEDTLQSIVFTPKDRTLYLYTQPVTKTDESTPVVDKYQFIKTNATSSDRLIDLALLALGIGIFVAAWIYVFRDNKKN